jgi:hypothetical protein
MPASFVYGQVAFDFQLEGGNSSSNNNKVARAIVKYRYYAQENRVEYISIDYTDPRLREKVESDPAMRERINEYVTKMLRKRNEGLS